MTNTNTLLFNKGRGYINKKTSGYNVKLKIANFSAFCRNS